MYWLFIAVGLLFALVYLTFIFREVPGAARDRFGEPEPPPENLGQWVIDSESPEAHAADQEGLTRETRLWLYGGDGSERERLVRQVRYRNKTSGAIERTEPERTVRRRRRHLEGDA